jgi:hypothetical protein
LGCCRGEGSYSCDWQQLILKTVPPYLPFELSVAVASAIERHGPFAERLFLVLGMRLARGLEFPHKIGRIESQAVCHLEQIMQPEIALAALDLPKERPVNPAAFRHVFLAQAQLIAPGPDPIAQGRGSCGDRSGHSPNSTRLNRLRPEPI